MINLRRLAASARQVLVRRFGAAAGQARVGLVLAVLVLVASIPAGARAQSGPRPPSAGSPAVPASAPPAAAAPAVVVPPAVTVTASVDRPAIWVADRLTYTVEIVCRHGVDILVDDLGRDKLKLTGLEVVGADVRRREEDDATRYAFDYTLTTYRLDVPTPVMGSFPVRYYLTRAGQRPQEAAPAGSVLVPPVAVAFRSLLPDDQAIYDVRDQRLVPPRWLPYRVLGRVGLGLVLVSVTPAVLLLIRIVTGARARRRVGPTRSLRHARQTARAALENMRATDAVDLEARRDGFARLDALVRQHVTEVCGVAAAGMTPDEIDVALQPYAGRIPVDLVTSILASCELARYGRPDLQPSPEMWHEAVGQADRMLSAR
jgi:hypothetical protein